jgi:flagellar biosynthesis protein FlhF
MMKIRKFAATSTAEAFRMVQRELGKDALILGTTQRPRPDRDGNTVEVVAASGGRAQAGPVQMSSKGQAVTAQGSQAEQVRRVRELDAGVVSELRQIEQRLTEILAGLDLPEASEASATSSEAGAAEDRKASPILRERLLGAGFAPDLIDSRDHFLAAARNISLEALVRCLVKEVTQETPAEDVSVFVGPSGAGKTTTVLKIAAGMLVPNGAKPRVIYFGREEAAAGQLQSRCKKLHIKFKHVSGIAQMRKVLAKPSKFPILIDTPGISSLGEDELRFFVEKAKEQENVNLRLVVDAGMDPLNICAIASCLPDTSRVSLVLTKLDEATRIGGAVSAAIGNSLPVSYVTGGREVSDGIFVADSEILLEKVMDGMAASAA